eukprot:SAG25_NODE_14360_length_256_cov_0.541401_1_plen_34_part_10
MSKQMRCRLIIMAVVTTNTSPRALSHQTLAPGKL